LAAGGTGDRPILNVTYGDDELVWRDIQADGKTHSGPFPAYPVLGQPRRQYKNAKRFGLVKLFAIVNNGADIALGQLLPG
jgi:hypothetical protein